MELFSFGMISRFYADMPVKDKRNFTKENFNTSYQQLKNWLLCLSTLRNRCAHYMRLYDYTFIKRPQKPRNGNIQSHNKIFNYIYIMKYVYPNADKWENSFLLNLQVLIEHYTDHIKLKHIGFPEKWEALLKN